MAKFGNMNPYDAAVPVRDAFERPEQTDGKERAVIQMCDSKPTGQSTTGVHCGDEWHGQ
jgi:hypothetical protein